jgi:two-component system response regulator HupR/HoxA
VPPLRSRAEDIPSLAEHFMKRFVAETGKHGWGITTRALRALVVAPWPGNVRELEHEVRRLVYLCPEGQPITSEMLSPAVLAPARRHYMNVDGALTLGPRVDELERTMIALALARAHGQQAAAARLLGISRYGLRLKIERLGLKGG